MAAFSDNKNIVLYPQFRAKEFTLILDYQGAAVTGSRSMKVAYNSEISELPLNLTLENKNFVGWYTQPNKQGIQVSDQYGVIPLKNIVNESIFDLSDPQGGIYLYAGFKNEEFTVSFYFTESGAPEEVKVEYGTPISEVQLETRVDGKAVIAWSKKRNDTNKENVFDGKVTSDMVLYATEYAPVIDFNSNGGNAVNYIIAREGDTISLPTPTRENYNFVGWETASGSTFNATTMPSTSVKLTAKWQAMIIFDTNGGTEAKSISEPQGTNIVLPKIEKEGYIFAGWFNESGEKYTNTVMPDKSVLLKAKFYAYKTIAKVLLSENSEMESWYETPNMSKSVVLDLSEIYNMGVTTIKVAVYYQSEVVTNMTGLTSMVWFSADMPSEAYKVWEYTDKKHSAIKSWTSQSYSTTLELNTEKYYICLCHNGWSSTGRWKNFMVEIEYPDMSTLC